MAVAAFVGQVPDLSGLDPRWLLAGGAAAVGLMLLVGSLRGRRNGQPLSQQPGSWGACRAPREARAPTGAAR